MKPRYRPGKPATAGSAVRKALIGAKSAMVRPKKKAKKGNKKEGRGGAKKTLDFIEAPTKRMKGAEYDAFSHEGVRRLPKKGGTFS